VPSTAGLGDLVAAFTGGGQLEQDAYSKAALRLMSAQNTQAQMDKTVQQAYDLKKQSSNKEAFGNILAELGPEMQGQNYQITPEQLSNAMRYGVGGGVTDPAGMLSKLQKEFMSQRMLEGRSKEMTDPNAVASAYFEQKPVATVQKIGDLMVEGGYGSNPQVNQIMTAMNAVAGSAADKSGRGTEKERQIQAIMQRIDPETGKNYTRQEAEDRVWFEDINVNAVTGQPFLKNSVTQQISPVELTGAGGDTPSPSVPQGETFYDLAGQATGPANMAKDLWARASSLVGGSPDFESTQAIENITVNLQQIIRGLSISDRNPVTEQERLLEWIKLEPGWLTSAGTFRARVSGANKALTAKLAASERDAADYTLPPQIQKAAQQDVRTVTQALNVLGHPDWRMQNLPPILLETVRAELMAHPQWQEMNEKEREELVRRYALERSENGY